MRLSLVVSLGVALTAVADAQQASTAPQRTYGSGVVVVVGGERFTARNLVLARDTLTFTVQGAGDRRSYPLSRVEYASRIRSHATEGALFGGALMLISGLLAFAEIGADPTVEANDNATGIVAAFTAGGALLGAVIGSQLREEKSIIQNGRPVATLGVLLRIPRSPASIGLLVVHSPRLLSRPSRRW